MTNYETYLQSPHWRRIRIQYRQSHPWLCGVCGATELLELHHKTYERIGSERLDDLIPLCAQCHPLVHQLHQEQIATLDPTTIFNKQLGEQRKKERLQTANRLAQEAQPDRERLLIKQKTAQTQLDHKKKLVSLLAQQFMAHEDTQGYLVKQSAKRRIEEVARAP